MAIAAIAEYQKDYGTKSHATECAAMLDDLNERLDRKAYESARLYFNMEDYKAARVAFRNTLKDNADNIYREDILYYIAKSSYKYAQLSVHSKQKERYLTFIDDYLNFVGEIPQSKYSKELKTLYARAQKALGRNTSDEEIAGTDKSFAKERKTAEKADKQQNKK